ncbi:MAG: paraquat-inducible protein A [Steroidobacteraceae bacterium]
MIIACSRCGALCDLVPLPAGTTAFCSTCESPLERTRGRSIPAALACATATLVLLVPANVLPLLTVSLLGATHVSRLGSGVVVLWDHQWVIVAVLVGAFAVVLPFIRYGLLSTVLALVLAGRRPRRLGQAFRWAIWLDAWSMPDVFLIGLAVGYSRVAANLPATIGPGGFCLIAAAFLSMLSRATLDRRTVWRAIHLEQPLITSGEGVISCTSCDLVLPAEAEGSSCPRCRSRVHARKPDSILRTAALCIAAFALYIPANVYPMSTDVQLGELVPHRIVDGIRELYQAGLWPLGILIFCTSIAIPLLKLAGLGWFLLSIRSRSRGRLRFKTRLYRLIDEIGRWSSTDVFTIAVFLPVLQFGGILSTRTATGAPAFFAVVVLTMLAARTFDPRLMWDVALAGDAPPGGSAPLEGDA